MVSCTITGTAYHRADAAFLPLFSAVYMDVFISKLDLTEQCCAVGGGGCGKDASCLSPGVLAVLHAIIKLCTLG